MDLIRTHPDFNLKMRFKDAENIIRTDKYFQMHSFFKYLKRIDIFETFEQFIKEEEELYEIKRKDKILEKRIQERNNRDEFKVQIYVLCFIENVG